MGIENCEKQSRRPQESILFDQVVKDHVLSNPDAKNKKIADELGVPLTRVINSIHRLQSNDEIPMKKRKFKHTKGKHVDKRELIESVIWRYIDDDADNSHSPSAIVQHLEEKGIITGSDLVSSIMNDMGIQKVEPNKEGVIKDGMEVQQIFQKSDHSNAKKRNPVRSLKRIEEIKIEPVYTDFDIDTNIARYYKLGFSDVDIIAIEVLTEDKLRQSYKRLKEKDLLGKRPDHLIFLDHTPSCPNSSGE